MPVYGGFVRLATAGSSLDPDAATLSVLTADGVATRLHATDYTVQPGARHEVCSPGDGETLTATIDAASMADGEEATFWHAGSATGTLVVVAPTGTLFEVTTTNTRSFVLRVSATQYVTDVSSAPPGGPYLPLSGGTMTGPVTWS